MILSSYSLLVNMSTQVGIWWTREQNDRFVAVARSECRNREYQAEVFLEVVLLIKDRILELHRHMEFPEPVQSGQYRTKVYIREDVYQRYADWAAEFGLKPSHFISIVLINMMAWYDRFVPQGRLFSKEGLADLLAERLAICHAGVNID